MQTQFILRMVLAVLAIEYANAETIDQRNDFHFRMEINESYPLMPEDSIHNILADLGLAVDDGSEVYIHEEESYIDFSCFNCITDRISSNEEIQHSHNWRLEK